MKKDVNKVIVTGGAGFIGSHLSETLAESGNNVIIIDDLSTGKKQRIDRLIERENIQFVCGSINDLILLGEIFKGVKVVFHLAAIPSVPRSIDDPISSHQVNATGTLNVLLASKDNEVEKVIYSSSSSVYGDTPVLPKREDMKPHPFSPYAVSKLTGEYYCRVFQEVYKLKTVCLRYFNVYGPGQDPDSQYAAVIPRFIRNFLDGVAPVIFSDGEQTRDFTYVDDAVQANIKAAESDVTGIFNVGSGTRVTINELTHLIRTLCKSDLEPIHDAPRPGDVRDSLADISEARRFGYKPHYSLEEGLREAIRSFQHEQRQS